MIRHCLEKRPEERFQSARDLAFDLRALAGVRSGRSRVRPWIGVACVVIATLLISLTVGGWWQRWFRGRPTTHVERIQSLVVLPLENLSGDPQQEYFADGMTDALISNMGRISALRVISRTSAMRFKGTDKAIPQIARELKADKLIEGTVLRVSGRVRVTVELIDAVTDAHQWSNSYEQDERDVITLQNEVARAVAREIQVELTALERNRMASAPSIDPEAHRLYLKGRHHWNRRTETDFNKAVDYFRRAIERAPAYTQAHAALAECYVVLPPWSVLPPKEAYPVAKQAATKALELDSSLAEAHAALGCVAAYYEWDWAAAQREFKAALQLNPGYATAHQWYAEYLAETGRHGEAIVEIRRALELDPLSPMMNSALGVILFWSRRSEQAIEQARQLLEELEELSKRRYVPPSFVATIYAGLGEKELAFEYLEKACEVRDGNLFLLNTDPAYEPLRDHPRFDDVLRCIGLEP